MDSDWYIIGLIARQHYATVGDFLVALALANVQPGPKEVAELYEAWKAEIDD